MTNVLLSPLELSTVEEDQDIAYPDLHADIKDDATQAVELQESVQDRPVQDVKSPGGVSAFSGTTARTSRSAIESADLHSDDVLDAFPALVHSSDELLGFLLPDELSEASIIKLRSQVQSKDSRAYKKFIRLGKTFQVQRDVFGSDNLISSRRIVKILLGSKDDSETRTEPWRPDVLLQKTNLAVLASCVLTYSKHADNEAVWQELEQGFPIHFMEGFEGSADPSQAFSALSQETLQLALEIRTQYVIMLLRGLIDRSKIASDLEIYQMFYKDPDNLRGWDIAGLRSEDLDQDTKQLITQRIEAIRRVRDHEMVNTSENHTAFIDHLSGRFPWASFAYQSMTWISQRLEELQIHMAKADGADTIIRLLEEEVERRKAARPSNDDAVDESPELVVLQYEMPSEIFHTGPEPGGEDQTAAIRVKQLKSAAFR